MKKRVGLFEFGSRHAFVMAVIALFALFCLSGCGGGGGSSSDSGGGGTTPPPSPPPDILPGPDPLTVNISSVQAANCPVQLGDPAATVTIFLDVLDKKGNPLTDADLTAANFSVTVDGVAVPISASNLAYNPSINQTLAVSLVTDYSGSLSDADLKNIESAQIDFIKGLDPSDAAELIKFKNGIDVIQDYTTDKLLLEAAVTKPYQGPTGPGSWLFTAVNQGIVDTSARFEQARAIIAISDGDVFLDPLDINQVITLANQFGIPVYTIGLGSFIRDNVMGKLAADTKGVYYKTDISSALDEIYNSIGLTLVEGWTITFQRPFQQSPNSDTIVVQVASTAGETGSDTETVTPCP